MIALRWIGYRLGVEGLQSVPARDLTEDEVIRFGGEKSLVSTGLYEVVKQEQKVSRKNAGTESDTSDTTGE